MPSSATKPAASKSQTDYPRKQFLDPTTGRFNRLDPFFGNLNEPQSFNKYLYAHSDPVQGIDPSGEFFVTTAISLLGGAAFGTGLQLKYNSQVLSIGGAIVGSGLTYLGFTQLGNINRMWLGGHTEKVNLYVTPLQGEFANNNHFRRYRRMLLAQKDALESKLNSLEADTKFSIIDGALAGAKGYDKGTKTMDIPIEWASGTIIIAQGQGWQVNVFPDGYKRQLQFLIDGGVIQNPTGAEESTYLGNMILHELAHVILGRTPWPQFSAWRDHTWDGLMGGGAFGQNPSFNNYKRELADYDDGTAAALNAALGYHWRLY